MLQSIFKLNIDIYKLNSLHYISLPGFSFDSFLKLSEVELETIQDEQMLKDFISAMRGGISCVKGNSYIKSQNYSQGHSHSQSQTQSQIIVKVIAQIKVKIKVKVKVKVKDLYGTSIPKIYMALHKSKSCHIKILNTLDKLLNTLDDGDYGYWFICDLEYTNECKGRTSNFQLLPYKRDVENNELGYKQKLPTSSKSEKLILDQNNKYEHPIHYRTLMFVVKMGIKVTKVHRIIKFKQDYIIRDFVELKI